MKKEARSERRARIEAAAYEILSLKGYSGTSMLSIARRAKCSNETLYNWYGDKVGLFRSMVESNAEQARDHLEKSLSQDSSLVETLQSLGPLLLRILLSEKAIALNRAAAADSSGELGAALSSAGRETILPLLVRVLVTARRRDEVQFTDEADAAELYLSLLVGDLQIRRAIGRLPVPDDETIRSRAERALKLLMLWCGSEAVNKQR